MGYASDYLAVVNAIRSKLTGISSIKHVVFGEKENIGSLQFPCAFIIPGADEIEDATNVEIRHNYNFDIVILLRNYEVEAGLNEVVTLAGQCYDAFSGDRQLGGLALWVKVTSVEPGYGRAEGGPVVHWATIGLTVVKVI
ncbi:MAG: hypothetical protein ACPLRW_07135 [Moorellales bacterium]